ncbi:MAG: hypothetical protein ACLPKB_34425 [Xanthobacteraceae bacterium]
MKRRNRKNAWFKRGTMSDQARATQQNAASWWRRTFGRSIIKAIVGDFFSSKRNTASVIAIGLIFTVCWVVVIDKKYEYLDKIVNVIFVIIGFYFGTKPSTGGDDDED